MNRFFVCVVVVLRTTQTPFADTMHNCWVGHDSTRQRAMASFWWTNEKRENSAFPRPTSRCSLSRAQHSLRSRYSWWEERHQHESQVPYPNKVTRSKRPNTHPVSGSLATMKNDSNSFGRNAVPRSKNSSMTSAGMYPLFSLSIVRKA